MIKQTSFFEEILRGELCPWLEQNRNDEKFIPVLSDIKTIPTDFHPIYEFDFYRYFNPRTRFYHKLLINETNKYCNDAINYISSGDDTRIIKYRIREILKTKLPTVLKDISRLIKSGNYYLIHINPEKINPAVDTDHKTETYVIQLLKVATIKSYLEIQAKFTNFFADDLMELEDLYLQFLAEPLPEKTFLKSTIPIISINPEIIKNEITSKQKTIKSQTYTFKYKHLIKKPDSITNLLNSLKLYNLVDKKTTIYDLKKIFSNDANFKPVTWTGNVSDLYYFIALIHNVNKSIENISPYHWQITCNCFVKPDGSSFDPANLKSQKKPKANAGLIEKVASQLN